MQIPPIRTLSRKYAARKVSAFVPAKDHTGRPPTKVRSRGITPLRSLKSGLDHNLTMVSPTSPDVPKADLMATLDYSGSTKGNKHKLELAMLLEQDLAKLEHLEQLKRETEAHILKRQRDLALLEYKTNTQQTRKPQQELINIKPKQLPKINLKNIKLQPVIHKKTSSLTTSPQFSPQPLSPPQQIPKDIPVSIVLKQENTGPEKSRKLRELIEAQTKKYEVLEPPTEIPMKEKHCESGLVTVIEEKSEDEKSVVCLETGATPRSSFLAKKKTTDTYKNSYLCGASKGLYSTIDTMKESKKQESTENSIVGKVRKDPSIELDTSLEENDDIKGTEKSKLNDSLVEILQTVDLRAAREEIQNGFMRQLKDYSSNEKAKQIAKIRAKIRKKHIG